MISIPITSPTQWHALRAQCVVTASTVAALLTDHPYETPFSIYMRATGQMDPLTENDAMAAGTDAELMMPARVRRLRPDLDLRKLAHFYRHDKLRFGGTPDFGDQHGGLWQGKSTDPAIFARDWAMEPPLWVLIQHQAEYLLTGRQHGGIVCLVRDRLFSTYLHEVEPHDGTLRAIERAAAEIEERVANRDPPPADFRRDAELLIELHAHAQKGKTIDLSADNYLADLCGRYAAAAATISATEEDKEALKAEILTKIGDASKALVTGFTISAPEVKASAGTIITPAMVGTMIGSRAGYRSLRVSERNA